MMKINALLPYFGCKRGCADQIIPHLGEHKAYWEPFCGSMAILLAKPECRQETVNDLNGDALNLAKVIADPVLATQFEWQLRRTLVHEQLYRETVETLRGTTWDPAVPSVARARTYFIASWMGMNGITGTKVRSNFARRYTSNGGCPAVRFASAVDSIPEWHERLRPVAIYHGCGIELCEKIEDKPGTVIYCDPPYIVKSDEYLYDFESSDHLRLAMALRGFQQTRVVVSYYDHPDLEQLYPGWRKVDLTATKNLARGNNLRTRGGEATRTKAPEILLMNQPE
jgi:DNA adenine methylase